MDHERDWALRYQAGPFLLRITTNQRPAFGDSAGDCATGGFWTGCTPRRPVFLLARADQGADLTQLPGLGEGQLGFYRGAIGSVRIF
jgi:hypothetical protein